MVLCLLEILNFLNSGALKCFAFLAAFLIISTGLARQFQFLVCKLLCVLLVLFKNLPCG